MSCVTSQRESLRKRKEETKRKRETMEIFRNGSLNFIAHLNNLTEWEARQLKGTDYKQRNAIRIVLVQC